MPRLLVLLALAGLVYGGVRKWRRLSPREQRGALRVLSWSAPLLFVLPLVLAGRVHWLSAVVLAALAAGRAAFRAFGRPGVDEGTGPASGPSSEPPPGTESSRGRTAMTEAQACAVLGLAPGASREEVLAAHRRLIQKVHPDAGGSDYLAAEINRARDRLLGRR